MVMALENQGAKAVIMSCLYDSQKTGVRHVSEHHSQLWKAGSFGQQAICLPVTIDAAVFVGIGQESRLPCLITNETTSHKA